MTNTPEATELIVTPQAFGAAFTARYEAQRKQELDQAYAAGVAATDGCDHEYTLNVQLTHAWCQKCDSILPLVAGSIRDTIFAAGRAEGERRERQRIRAELFSCTDCGEVHKRHMVERKGGLGPSWASLDDGHLYRARVGAYNPLRQWLADLLDGGGQDTP